MNKFTVKELVALIGMITVCGVVLTVAIAGIFRPIAPETRQDVYELLSTVLGLVGGLLAGGAIGYKMGKEAAENEEK